MKNENELESQVNYITEIIEKVYDEYGDINQLCHAVAIAMTMLDAITKKAMMIDSQDKHQYSSLLKDIIYCSRRMYEYLPSQLIDNAGISPSDIKLK